MTKPRLQPIYNIASLLVAKGIKHIVLSPGSRCAPLTLAYARHEALTKIQITDERSAGFVALGIAQHSKQAVALTCTSGTAVLNYAPAIAEAFYQQIPLVFLTADRPQEWVDQQDGQTIRQHRALDLHCKKSYQLPADYEHADAEWYIYRTINEAINLAKTAPYGPVHVNIPIREPFYLEADEAINYESVPVVEQINLQASLDNSLIKQLQDRLNNYTKVMIVAGQTTNSIDLSKLKTPVLYDHLSNCKGNIRLYSTILSIKNEALKNDLQPELLITFGGAVLSKELKIYLRTYRPKEHWHISQTAELVDTFQVLTHNLVADGNALLNQLSFKETTYLKAWEAEETKALQYTKVQLASISFGEFKATSIILKHLPAQSIVHFANSMPVRYGAYIPYEAQLTYSNRGTSGIDGSVSTAVGTAIVSPDKLNVLITGDLSLFYDRNGLWNNHLPPNLRIIVLNNHAGGIFRMIDGPGRLPELAQYFETSQTHNAELLAKEHDLAYFRCDDQASLEATLNVFFTLDGQAKLIEIESDSAHNTQLFKQFKNAYHGK